jgi:hypothetical protein
MSDGSLFPMDTGGDRPGTRALGRELIRAGTMDAELVALLWLLLDVRTPVVVTGGRPAERDAVLDGVADLLPASARLASVTAGDDFVWLPEATALGWRAKGSQEGRDAEQPVRAPAGPAGKWSPAGTVSPAHTVLVVRGLADAAMVNGGQARLVVRALALGYGLLATMSGAGLHDVLTALDDPSVGTDADERSRLGVVLALAGADDGPGPRVLAAHYVRPVALDTHGHIQRPAPAVLATWNGTSGRYDHFAWGALPDLAGRTGMRPIDFEREQARRAALLGSGRPR